MELKVSIMPDGYDDNGEPIFTSVSEAIASQAMESVRRTVERDTTQLVRDELKSIVHERLTQIINRVIEATTQPTSAFGEPKGEPVTLREMIERSARSFYAEKVDHRGSPDRYGKVTRIQWAIQDMASSIYTEHFKAETAKIKKQVSEALAAKIAGSE
jgi:hypothetical protein